ncbi:3-hydroxybutyryl-CoA dehydrogenase [Caballeronia arvi]|uniref:3-hydroxybutyryl-CoA dehydrogenase n=2 Tax=Caballeronia arvi TaxID=1777135 RepID=A0A158J317_9BURK|nr:3-hydroxybutyryl-CoA dehydrogenase [Caballeronia arvi]
MKKIGIVGAGQMGCGIAQVCAAAELEVVLSDVSEDALNSAKDLIGRNFAKRVQAGKMSASDATAALERITVSTNLSDFSDCDCVIEAATESARVKEQILASLEAVIRPDAVLATNTSSVSITSLGAAVVQSSRFIGMHFFNPVPAMTLVEVIRGMRTDEATSAAANEFAERLGKHAISVMNSPGFVVNRILIPMINEAILVLQEGLASAVDIDEGMKRGANHPIGPLALADLIGLDTVLAIMTVLQGEFGDPKYRPALLLREMVAAGALGRKSGQGFHTY